MLLQRASQVVSSSDHKIVYTLTFQCFTYKGIKLLLLGKTIIDDQRFSCPLFLYHFIDNLRCTRVKRRHFVIYWYLVLDRRVQRPGFMAPSRSRSFPVIKEKWVGRLVLFAKYLVPTGVFRKNGGKLNYQIVGISSNFFAGMYALQ